MAQMGSQHHSLNPSTELPWITFSGAPSESPSAFIQSVQRLAFQHGRVSDDRWLAEYASTCFSDDSLLWYSDLEEETCNSWRKLRKAILHEYYYRGRNPGALSKRGPLEWAGTPGPPTAGPTRLESPTSSSILRARRGVVEVFSYSYPETIGYLAYNQTSSAISIVQDLNLAQVISLPRNAEDRPFNIRIEELPTDFRYSYLGLLLQINDVNAPHTVPPGLTYPGGISSNRVKPSSLCLRKNDINTGQKAIATWALQGCAESNPIPRYRRIAGAMDEAGRASSAVWRYDNHTDQLSMTWMLDDDTETEIAAVVPDGGQGVLHFHRIQDLHFAAPYLNEARVKLYFVPEESS